MSYLRRSRPQGIIAVLASNRDAVLRIAAEDFKQFASWANGEVYSIELNKGTSLIDSCFQYYGEAEDAVSGLIP